MNSKSAYQFNYRTVFLILFFSFIAGAFWVAPSRLMAKDRKSKRAPKGIGLTTLKNSKNSNSPEDGLKNERNIRHIGNTSKSVSKKATQKVNATEDGFRYSPSSILVQNEDIQRLYFHPLKAFQRDCGYECHFLPCG